MSDNSLDGLSHKEINRQKRDRKEQHDCVSDLLDVTLDYRREQVKTKVGIKKCPQ